MSKIIDLPTFQDERGGLTVIENEIGFSIKRVYYMYGVDGVRGEHRHKKTIQALICLVGSCSVYLNDGVKERTIQMARPNKCLILEPKDWHSMSDFSSNCVILVLASETYDKEDYIDEPY